MNWPWHHQGDERTAPRLRHWALAAVILFVMGLVLPVFLAFI